MKIAIHAADLDHGRIDGTRVYILNLLKQFGKIAPHEDFLIYHKNIFNTELAPPKFANYKTKALGKFPSWTHTRFAWEIFRDRPDALWVPLHNLPLLRRKDLKTIVTIHDLAFKFFPEYFTKWDLFKLNILSDHAVKKADKIIAISNATKQDILKIYPGVDEKKIKVIYHGFDGGLFGDEANENVSSDQVEKILKSYKLEAQKYLLYVGAIQPRKNLIVLIEAFEKIKKLQPKLKLVFAGEKAWLCGGIAKKIENSDFKEDIVITGKVPFAQMPTLYRSAAVFVFPSLYEGFGMPILEAFASNVPVVLANNSCLPEVGGRAALYFEGGDSADLKRKILSLLENPTLKNEMIAKGKKRLEDFSWEKCAEQTLEVIRRH